MKIALTRGQFATIDDADAPLVASYKWYAVQAKSKTGEPIGWYAVTNDLGDRIVYMHRMLLGATGAVQVDHKDGDGLNNVRSNIRLCTQSQNNANRRSKLPSSGYRGVHKHGNKWRAISTNSASKSRNVYLGSFDTPIAAAIAYDKATLDRFGEFATLNFPEAVAE